MKDSSLQQPRWCHHLLRWGRLQEKQVGEESGARFWTSLICLRVRPLCHCGSLEKFRIVPIKHACMSLCEDYQEKYFVT